MSFPMIITQFPEPQELILLDTYFNLGEKYKNQKNDKNI